MLRRRKCTCFECITNCLPKRKKKRFISCYLQNNDLTEKDLKNEWTKNSFASSFFFYRQLNRSMIVLSPAKVSSHKARHHRILRIIFIHKYPIYFKMNMHYKCLFMCYFKLTENVLLLSLNVATDFRKRHFLLQMKSTWFSGVG